MYRLPYDYGALYRHLTELLKAYHDRRVDDDELLRASEVLSPNEFEVFKAFNIDGKSAKDTLDDLVNEGLSEAESRGRIPLYLFKIRSKGFETKTALSYRPPATDLQLRVVKLTHQGMTESEIAERLGSSPKSISMIRVKMRRKYPQFMKGDNGANVSV